LENDIVLECGLTYRAFWHVWEHAELVGGRGYQRYIGKNENVARMYLEMVVWCRNIAYRAAHFGEGELKPISEKKAQRIRAEELAEWKKKSKAKTKAAVGEMTPKQKKCKHASKSKIKRNGVRMWKCDDCHHRWPREGSTTSSDSTGERRKKASSLQVPSKAPKNAKKRKKKAS
jgi:ribosomal protein L37AE/L43A